MKVSIEKGRPGDNILVKLIDDEDDKAIAFEVNPDHVFRFTSALETAALAKSYKSEMEL